MGGLQNGFGEPYKVLPTTSHYIAERKGFDLVLQVERVCEEFRNSRNYILCELTFPPLLHQGQRS